MSDSTDNEVRLDKARVAIETLKRTPAFTEYFLGVIKAKELAIIERLIVCAVEKEADRLRGQIHFARSIAKFIEDQEATLNPDAMLRPSGFY